MGSGNVMDGDGDWGGHGKRGNRGSGWSRDGMEWKETSSSSSEIWIISHRK